MLRLHLPVILLALAAPLLAQSQPAAEPLSARNFHFDDYRSVAVLDLQALRNSGVWDEMNTSAIRLAAAEFEQQYGFSLDHLDRVTTTRARCAVDGVLGEGPGFHDITTLEANATLGEPQELQHGRYEIEQTGRHTLHVDQWDRVLAKPDPQLHVYGPAGLLRDVLAGKPRAGLPSPDVMDSRPARSTTCSGSCST
jgi:hypothetical protein